MKDQDQDRKARGMCDLLPTYIAVALLIVIFCVVVFAFEDTRTLLCSGAEKGQSCIKQFILDFQTLITGIFAVIAAYATVQAMQRTDSKADIRHQELIALSLRPAALEIDRFLKERIIRIKDQIPYLIQFCDIKFREFRKEEDLERYRDLIAGIDNRIVIITNFTKKAASESVARHFDGETISLAADVENIDAYNTKQILYDIKITLDRMKSTYQTIRSINKAGKIIPHIMAEKISEENKLAMDKEYIKAKAESLEASVAIFVARMNILIERLELLHTKYSKFIY